MMCCSLLLDIYLTIVMKDLRISSTIFRIQEVLVRAVVQNVLLLLLLLMCRKIAFLWVYIDITSCRSFIFIAVRSRVRIWECRDLHHAIGCVLCAWAWFCWVGIRCSWHQSMACRCFLNHSNWLRGLISWEGLISAKICGASIRCHHKHMALVYLLKLVGVISPGTGGTSTTILLILWVLLSDRYAAYLLVTLH